MYMHEGYMMNDIPVYEGYMYDTCMKPDTCMKDRCNTWQKTVRAGDCTSSCK